MKQYLDQQQTAKLIELGFEKPKNTQYIQRAKARNLHSPFIEFGEPEFEGSYSIGELIEMLPKHIHLDGLCLDLHIYANQHLWVVGYSGLFCEKCYRFCSRELADALYDMIIMLKEEGIT